VTRSDCAVLVMAKAPLPGQVKTRLGDHLGHDVAAELAAASLLDTLDTCSGSFAQLHLALAGGLRGAVRAVELRERLGGWTVHDQRGVGFAARLANAHDDAGGDGRPVVQIGMDTPHLTADHLHAVADALINPDGVDAVLGPAEDGGWWVLGVTHPRFARPLASVEMSTTRTCADTRAALEAGGARVRMTTTFRDVDTVSDAQHAASAAPSSRFATAWERLRIGDGGAA
jgi:glycosyltransferase A (GT-A) superfamily protein (DUF2064 family)